MRLRATLLAVMALSVLCAVVSATDLECIVTRGGALEDGVQVTLCPGGATEPTNGGMALFTNVAPGEYTLTAQKTIGTKLYGALEEGVTVLADSHHVVNVELTEAVYIPPCFPLALNNEWVYATWNKEAGGTATKGSRTEKVTGTQAIAGERAQVIQFTESGGTVWSAYQASSRCGWAYYGDLIGAVTKLFDPCLRIPRILPLKQSVAMKTLVKSSDGSPDVEMEARVTFVGSETITVPAGKFACAQLDIKLRTGREDSSMSMWVAPNVGVVRVYEQMPDREHKRNLERFEVRGVRPLPGPTLPGPLRPGRGGG